MDELFLYLASWCAGLLAVCGIAQAIYDRFVFPRIKAQVDKELADLFSAD